MSIALFALALALAAQETPPAALGQAASAPAPDAAAPSGVAPAAASQRAATTDSPPPASVDPQGAVATQAGAAPTDPFGLVAWCAGAVQGYLALKPDVFSEVKRIETQFRRPGSNLAEDLQDYADMEKDARRQMGVFQEAIGAAERASPTDLSATGLSAYKRGLAVWAAPTGSTRARIAREWMSWALPATCETTAKTLTTQASLMGEALKPATGSSDEAASQPSPTPVADAVTASPPPQDQAAAVAAATPDAAQAAPAPADATPPPAKAKARSSKKKTTPNP